MTGAAMPSWINKRQPLADWPDWLVDHAPSKVEPNGSFTLQSLFGQARVHLGHMVFEFGGAAHVCHPSEAKATVAALLAAAAPPPPPAATRGAPRQLVADVAELADDTDEITRRIRASRPQTIKREVVRQMPQRTSPARPPVRLATARKFADPKGMPPSIEMRHPSELKVDDSYQRSIDTGPSRALINRIANEWDWRMCMPLVVSRREDGFYVIDGQHRHAAALARGDIPYLPCCVAVYENVADEAAMFVAMNRSRRAMNRLDDFHAAQAGEDPEATAVTALIEGAGFTVSRRTGSGAWAPGEVAFTSAIAKARRRQGEQIAREALEMMAVAFAGQRLVVGSSIFTAIAAVLSDPPAPFDATRLAAALKTFDMDGWSSFINASRGGYDRHRHLLDMLLAAYADVVKAAAA